MHILFVCTGNTCRSPMAAFLAKAKIEARGLPWRVSSAGLHAIPGVPIAQFAADALKRRNVDMSQPHQSQPVTDALLNEVDLVLTMTSGHKHELIRRFPQAVNKVHELGAYICTTPVSTFGQYDIVDPFGGSEEVYEACALALEEKIELLLDKLAEQEKTDGQRGE